MNSRTLDRQLWKLHGIEPGPLHVGHNSVARSVLGSRGSGTRIIAGGWAGFFEPIPYGGLACLALKQGKGLDPAST